CLQERINGQLRALADFSRRIADLPLLQTKNVAAAAIEFFERLFAGYQSGGAALGLEDEFGLRRIGDQSQHKCDDCLALLGRERKLRHSEPLVVALVRRLVEVVAARFLELLIDE